MVNESFAKTSLACAAMLGSARLRPKGSTLSSALRIAVVTAVTAMLAIFSVPADAKSACRHNARDCHAAHHRAAHRAERSRDWYLHRPSTPRERAETRALNHCELAAVIAPGGDDDYRRSQMQYQRQLNAYRAAQARYEHDMNLYAARPRGRHAVPRHGFQNGRRDFPAASRRRAQWPEEEDNDPCAPTGGLVDSNIAAPTPGLDGAVTGLTQFNARASGLRQNCRRPGRR